MSFIKNKTTPKHKRNKRSRNRNRNRNIQMKNIINSIDFSFNKHLKYNLNNEHVNTDDWRFFENKHNHEFNATKFLFPIPNTNHDPNEGFRAILLGKIFGTPRGWTGQQPREQT